MTISLLDEPETVAERQAAAAKTLAELAKWHHCDHVDAGDVHDFADAVRRCIDRGHAPEFVWSDYYDAPNSYAWQVFCQTVADGIVMDRDALDAALADARERLDEGRGKPTATDGSKGQWRASLSSQIKTYEWLVEGEVLDA